ncbi:MAG TPA: cellulase family glycosylhydrolase [Steroidobacter sp.]
MTALPAPLRIDGRWFLDPRGRRVILRGVNLGGDCKVPYPNGGTQVPSDFSDHRSVTFVGRPFPLTEADEHLGRLAHWGFNVVRLLTTWEAVEHAGPMRYDEEYLEYLAAVCRKCGEHGLYVFIDFHQDVWSRMTGGDGAPGWTLDTVGLDFTKFHAAGAAHVMQAKYDYARGGRQDGYPQMSWALNYRLPANMILWTLFFGGRDFTPQFLIDGRNVQDYLQDHYLGAMREVALRVRHMPHVLGFDTLNEPGEGMIGLELDLRRSHPLLGAGLLLSPLDALLMARGLNPSGVCIWRADVSCPFEAAGAYRVIDDVVCEQRKDHFTRVGDRRVNFEAHHMQPFFRRVAQTVRDVREDWLLFAEINPYKAATGHTFPAGTPERTVNASHWYDLTMLRTKSFPDTNAIDAAATRERYVHEMQMIAAAGATLSPQGAPTLLGECGIPFDLDDGAAYRAWAAGDRSQAPWSKHRVAQSLMYDALDRLLLSSTQWNYTVSNRNDAACGDGWNQEDLSIFSRDQQDQPADPDSGGRAVDGFCRPYARRIAGEPLNMAFDLASGEFTLTFEVDPRIDAPTEIFVPRRQYPDGYTVEAPDCEAVSAESCVRIFCDGSGRRVVTVRRRETP